jgi:hypothetical protein
VSQYPPTGPGGFNPNPNPYASATGQGPIPAGTVKNYLVESILVLICCGCWPLAIPAIVYAAQVNGKLAAGDYAGAVQSSKSAKMWMMISAGAGILIYIFVIGVQILAAIAANQ